MISTGPVEKRTLAAVFSRGVVASGLTGEGAGEEEESMIYLYRTDSQLGQLDAQEKQESRLGVEEEQVLRDEAQ